MWYNSHHNHRWHLGFGVPCAWQAYSTAAILIADEPEITLPSAEEYEAFVKDKPPFDAFSEDIDDFLILDGVKMYSTYISEWESVRRDPYERRYRQWEDADWGMCAFAGVVGVALIIIACLTIM